MSKLTEEKRQHATQVLAVTDEVEELEIRITILQLLAVPQF